MCLQDISIGESTELVRPVPFAVTGTIKLIGPDAARIRLILGIINPANFAAGVAQDSGFAIFTRSQLDGEYLGTVDCYNPTIILRIEDVGVGIRDQIVLQCFGTYIPQGMATSVRLIRSKRDIEKGGQ